MDIILNKFHLPDTDQIHKPDRVPTYDHCFGLGYSNGTLTVSSSKIEMKTNLHYSDNNNAIQCEKNI